MIKFVLASHGKLAEGMRDSVSLILGESIELYTICAYTQGSEDVTEEIERLFDTFDEKDEIIVMTDLFGGSVSSAFARLMQKRKFWLVAGFSLGLVVDIMLIQDEEHIEREIETAIENARDLMRFYNPLLQHANKPVDTSELE